MKTKPQLKYVRLPLKSADHQKIKAYCNRHGHVMHQWMAKVLMNALPSNTSSPCESINPIDGAWICNGFGEEMWLPLGCNCCNKIKASKE